MEIRQLRYFVNAAKTLNFTEAARLSNITQSTLSQQIKQLETELQVLLFHRLGKHIQLTAEGKLFWEDAQKILEDERQSLQRLADLNQLQGGTINIGIALGLGLSGLLTEVLTEYNKQYPHVKMCILQAAASHLPYMLRQHDIDIAMTFAQSEKQEDIKEQPLFATRLCAVVNEHHVLSDKTEISLSQLAHQSLVLPSDKLIVRQRLDAAAREQGVTLQPAVEIDDLSHIIYMVRGGRWISILPDVATLAVRGTARISLQKDILLPASILSLSGIYQRKAVTEFLRLLYESSQLMLQSKDTSCEVCGEHFLV
jgi:LysR family cyn operon transcriptional activator